MDDILARLCEVPGVIGAAIFVNGKCQAQRLSPPHEPILLEEALTHLGHLGDALESIEGLTNRQSFFIRFQEGQFIVCQIGALCLVVLANIKTQAAILSIGLNVALLKLERMDQSALIAQQPPQPMNSFAPAAPNAIPARFSASVSQNLTPGLPSVPSMPRPSQPPPIPSFDAASAAFAAESFSTSALSASHMGDMVEISVIRHVIRAFGDYFEGDAQTTVRQTLQQKFGATPSSLPRTRYAYLIQELAALLPARSRKDFQSAVPQL